MAAAGKGVTGKAGTGKLGKAARKLLVERFAELADPDKAIEMAAYMKTDKPFYGIQKPDRDPVYREIAKSFPATTHDEYADVVMALWNGKHREEKYASLDYAIRFKKFVDTSMLPMYEQLAREAAWWDLVDPIATHLVGNSFLADRKTITPIMKKWIDDDDMWIRRTAILSQNRHKENTDEALLFRFCLKRADEKEFFIRKAIGWALREYSWKAPEAVKNFLLTNRDKLSPLSFREGGKQLMRTGHLK